MLPEIPRESALHPGPMASVYLELSRDRGGAPHEVRLRWEAPASQLSEQGADDKTVDAAGVAATEIHSQPGAAGRAVFAADGTPSAFGRPDLTDGIGALIRFTSA